MGGYVCGGARDIRKISVSFTQFVINLKLLFKKLGLSKKKVKEPKEVKKSMMEICHKLINKTSVIFSRKKKTDE